MRIEIVPQQSDQRSTENTRTEPDHAQSTAQKSGVPSKSYQIIQMHDIGAKIRVIIIVTMDIAHPIKTVKSMLFSLNQEQ